MARLSLSYFRVNFWLLNYGGKATMDKNCCKFTNDKFWLFSSWCSIVLVEKSWVLSIQVLELKVLVTTVINLCFIVKPEVFFFLFDLSNFMTFPFCCFVLIIVQICQNHYERKRYLLNLMKGGFFADFELSLSSAKEKGSKK